MLKTKAQHLAVLEFYVLERGFLKLCKTQIAVDKTAIDKTDITKIGFRKIAIFKGATFVFTFLQEICFEIAFVKSLIVEILHHRYILSLLSSITKRYCRISTSSR